MARRAVALIHRAVGCALKVRDIGALGTAIHDLPIVDPSAFQPAVLNRQHHKPAIGEHGGVRRLPFGPDQGVDPVARPFARIRIAQLDEALAVFGAGTRAAARISSPEKLPITSPGE